MTNDNIGLIGTGALGSAIGRHLLDNRAALKVYNRTPGRAEALVKRGAQRVDKVADIARECDVLITSLTDTTALEEILFAEAGLFHSPLDKPVTIIDVGTHMPESLVKVARKVNEAGSKFIESPVTGSVHDAERGTLGLFVGGDQSDLQPVKWVLDQISQEVYFMGPYGAGSSAKLALNLLVGGMAFGLGESIALLQATGMDVSVFLKALDTSGLRSPLYARLGQRYLEGDMQARFSLANLEKDIGYAREYSNKRGSSALLAGVMGDLLSSIEPSRKALDYSSLVSVMVEQSEHYSKPRETTTD